MFYFREKKEKKKNGGIPINFIKKCGRSFFVFVLFFFLYSSVVCKRITKHCYKYTTLQKKKDIKEQ